MIPFLISDSLRRTGGQTQHCPHIFMLANLGGHILGKQSLVDLTESACLVLREPRVLESVFYVCLLQVDYVVN